LAREKVQLAEKARGAVANDLVAGRVDDRNLTLLDCDERIARIADAVQHITDARRALLTQRRQSGQLRGRERRTGGSSHRPSVPAFPILRRRALESSGS